MHGCGIYVNIQNSASVMGGCSNQDFTVGGWLIGGVVNEGVYD